ncbi:MAG: hypothetical protein K2W99_04305 [Chthoniobacterales bacterium]|nr:hypothetical protein [Chthoniobacterales bacterium]
MLTIEQADHNLKITWSFAKPISSDITEFEKINTLDLKIPIEEAFIIMIGDEEVPVIVWRAFLSLVNVLLDRNIKLRFSCTSQKVKEALELFGFSLLGAVEKS